MVIKGFLVSGESAVVNGANAGSRTEMNFSHVINGSVAGSNFTTVIGITNLATSSQTVTITFYPNGGGPIAVSRTLSGNGALRETAQGLFDLPFDFQTGWVAVSGTAPLTGVAAYADSVSGGLAVVPAGTSRTSLFFMHIADGPPQWQTGLALLNSGTAAANVEVYAVNPTGSLIGSAGLTLDPGKKIANVIHELIPQALGVNDGFVYVRTTNKCAAIRN